MEKSITNPVNLMSVTDYAKKSKVTRQTVYNWVKEGKIKHLKFLGKPFVDISTKN